MPNEIMHIASFTMNKALFRGDISLNGTPRVFAIPHLRSKALECPELRATALRLADALSLGL
jgi:hypothetical protein